MLGQNFIVWDINNFPLLSRKELKGKYESSMDKICALN